MTKIYRATDPLAKTQFAKINTNYECPYIGWLFERLYSLHCCPIEMPINEYFWAPETTIQSIVMEKVSDGGVHYLHTIRL